MQTIRELWNNMFNNSLEIYKNEDESIIKFSMILHVLKEEHKKICEYVLELKHKNDLQAKEIFEYKKSNNSTSILCTCKTNNRTPLKTLSSNNEKTPIKGTHINQNRTASFCSSDNDDLFNHQITDQDVNISKENDNSLFIDDSIDEFNITCSPTLNNHRNKKKYRLKNSKEKEKNINDNVVMNTPTPIINRSRKLKSNVTSALKIESISASLACESIDSDETLFIPGNIVDKAKHTDSEAIGILENLKENVGPIKKKLKLNDSYNFVPDREDDSPDFLYKREAVRKKSERLKLQGWDCQDCEKYYATYKNKMSDEEIKKRMGQCSRHREKFDPNILTPKGFWNPEFSPTQHSMVFDI